MKKWVWMKVSLSHKAGYLSINRSCFLLFIVQRQVWCHKCKLTCTAFVKILIYEKQAWYIHSFKTRSGFYLQKWLLMCCFSLLFLQPKPIDVQVITHHMQRYAVWFGGSMLASTVSLAVKLSMFGPFWLCFWSSHLTFIVY